MRYHKVFIALLLLFIAGTFNATAQNLEEEILELVNNYRAQQRLQPLVMNEKASKAAMKHSKNMASGKIPLGHSGFDERMDGLADDIQGVKAFAENVAYGKTTPEGFVKMWLESPGHRKNIEGKYNITGIGIARSKNGKIFATQIFLNKK